MVNKFQNKLSIMNRYTIYCTEEQTKKALELGAPINTCGYYYKQQVGCNTISDIDLHIIPTAEQMIGWLEEQGLLIEFKRVFGKYAYRLMEAHTNGERNPQIHEQGFPSRKEATLAAIDSALDYLSKNKKYE